MLKVIVKNCKTGLILINLTSLNFSNCGFLYNRKQNENDENLRVLLNRKESSAPLDRQELNGMRKLREIRKITELFAAAATGPTARRAARDALALITRVASS